MHITNKYFLRITATLTIIKFALMAVEQIFIFTTLARTFLAHSTIISLLLFSVNRNFTKTTKMTFISDEIFVLFLSINSHLLQFFILFHQLFFLSLTFFLIVQQVLNTIMSLVISWFYFLLTFLTLSTLITNFVKVF